MYKKLVRGLQPGKFIVIWPHTKKKAKRKENYLWTYTLNLLESSGWIESKDTLNENYQKLNTYKETFDPMCRVHDKSLEHNEVDLLNVTVYILVSSALFWQR